MTNAWLLLMVSAMPDSVTGHAIETEEDRKAEQAELDAIREEARQRNSFHLGHGLPRNVWNKGSAFTGRVTGDESSRSSSVGPV